MTLPRAVVSGILLVQGPSFLVKIFSAVSKAILLDIKKILKILLIEGDSTKKIFMCGDKTEGIGGGGRPQGGMNVRKTSKTVFE